MALQIRRGTEAERTAGSGVVFAEGELVYITDTDSLYVGDGSTAGGVLLTGSALAAIGSYLVADTINSTLDLQQDLDLNGNDIIGTGNININGTITATGNINIGDNENVDTVDFTAKITSSLTPQADSTYDIGTMSARWQNGYFTGLVVDGQVDAVSVNADVVADNSTVMVDVSANTFTGNLTGNVTGNVSGNVTGDLSGNVTGNTTGYHTGDVKGSIFGDGSEVLVDAVNGRILAPVFNNVTGDVIGNVKSQNGTTVLNSGTDGTNANFTGSVVGNVTGDLSGNVTGNLTGNTTGYHTGDVKGSVFADGSTLLVDAVAGNIPGENISGTITATFNGNLTGDVAGTLTGNVITNLIDSEDSSFINCVPPFRFNSDLNVDQDLIVSNSIRSIGTAYLNNVDSQFGGEAPVFFNSGVEFNNTVIFNDIVTGITEINAFGQIASTDRIGVGIFNGVGLPTTPVSTISTTLADFGTAVKFASMDTSTRNALTAEVGMVIYNTDVSKLQLCTVGGGTPTWETITST